LTLKFSAVNWLNPKTAFLIFISILVSLIVIWTTLIFL